MSTRVARRKPPGYKRRVPSSAMPPAETNTPAIVIRARAFGDADKIVTFLTRDLGKVSGIAKGAKHSKRRFVNVLEPFTHVTARLRLRPNSDLAFISACELIDAHHAFARDLAKFARASYVLELTDRMVRGREAGAEVYELVRNVLTLLEGPSATADGVLRAFDLHLLRLTGYEPVLDRCRRCGTLADSVETLYVYAARGGVLCGGCRGDGRAYVVSRATLQRLCALASTPLNGGQTSPLELTPGMAAEARAVMRCFLAGNLSAPLASDRLLDELG